MQEVSGYALLPLIVARVQHHPSRAPLIPRLLEALSPLPTEVCTHSSDPPDPWAGYRNCLGDLPECSHVLIVQDDAQPCRNFAPAVEQIAQRHPDSPVCLFLGTLPSPVAAQARRVMKNNKRRYLPFMNAAFVPLVCVLWPRHKAQEFLHWTHGSHRITRADDANVARWMIRTRQVVQVTVPSLVEHDDFVPSVKGGRDHTPGAEGWRHALFLAEDGLDYEW